MTLYNLKSSDGQWRITKFDDQLNVESSYITSETECECPAGVRPSCRHRQMLPRMLNVGAEDSGMFYDFERDVFLEPIEGEDTQPVIISPIEYDEAVRAANESYISPPLPKGVTMVSLDDPETLHNTIAKAVGESAHPSISGPLKRRI